MKVLIRILYASSVFFAVAGAVKFLEGFPDTRGQIMDATAFSVSVVTLALVLEIREKME